MFLGAGAETHSWNGATEHSCFKMQRISRKFDQLITTIEKLAWWLGGGGACL